MVLNPREVLGVSQNASIDECKRAFKVLARKHHPDNGGDEDKFRTINEAMQVIERGSEVPVVTGRSGRNVRLEHETLFTFRKVV